MPNRATVTQVNYEAGMVKVILPEDDQIESDWIPLSSFEYNMPVIGDSVMVSFDDGQLSGGMCHGKCYGGKNTPRQSGANTFYREMCGDMVIVYDSANKTLTINAANVVINGNISITGNLDASGEVKAASIKGCPKCE